MADKGYTALLLEDIRDQNKAVLEAVGAIQLQLADVPKRAEFEDLRVDVKVIKAAITDLSEQVNDHTHRITHLEAA